MVSAEETLSVFRIINQVIAVGEGGKKAISLIWAHQRALKASLNPWADLCCVAFPVPVLICFMIPGVLTEAEIERLDSSGSQVL